MNPMVKAGAALSVSLLLISGCSSGKSNSNGEMNQDEQAITFLGRAYRDASLGLRRGPANVNELKPYLKKYGDPDKSLVSPNDGQPYQIVWGLMPGRPSRSLMEHPILAYEQTGKNGKRYVLDPMLRVHHVTEKEFTAMQESKPKQGSK